jgi:hypothetical protein
MVETSKYTPDTFGSTISHGQKMGGGLMMGISSCSLHKLESNAWICGRNRFVVLRAESRASATAPGSPPMK